MALSPISTQWSIDTTSMSVLSTLRGVLAAATSDNVQALAIMACQQFGNTLAICEETLTKIETSMVPTPPPATIAFLRATVGYSANDCAVQLGQSAEGLRFLGLAAALITTLRPYDGALAIGAMLKSSASDSTLLPTTRQLKDLLESLEGRSYRCGFANSVVGWQIMLRHEVGRSDIALSYAPFDDAPSPEIVGKLVDTFRQLGRIGEHAIIGATVTTHTALSWIVAFTKWCLGLPPSICMEDGREILRQPQSKITLVVSRRSKFEVTIHRSLSELSLLVVPVSASNMLVIGLVSVEKYGEWLLDQFEMNTEGLFPVLEEALQYVVPKVWAAFTGADLESLVEPPDASRPSCSHAGDTSSSSTSGGPHKLFGDICPLPGLRSIEDAYVQLLRPEKRPQFGTVGDGKLLKDFLLVSRFLESLRQGCRCFDCDKNDKGIERDKRVESDDVDMTGRRVFGATCKAVDFFNSVSFILADIMALSLFDSPAPLLVRPSTHRTSVQLKDCIRRFFHTDAELPKCDYLDILAWARDIVGHTAYDTEHGRYMDDLAYSDSAILMRYEGTIVTSSRGQVVFPALLDTLSIEKYGYLRLFCYPGALTFERETYRVVLGDYSHRGGRGRLADLDDPLHTALSAPLNLYTGLKCFWDVSTQDEGVLYVQLRVRLQTGELSSTGVKPMDLLAPLMDTLLLERCPHYSEARLDPVEGPYYPTSLTHSHGSECDTPSHMEIIPVNRAEDLRCFALANITHKQSLFYKQVALRKDACLSCCLRRCREAGVQVLIM